MTSRVESSLLILHINCRIVKPKNGQYWITYYSDYYSYFPFSTEIIKNPQRWPDVLENCLKLIQVLSACQDNKKLLVENHCFELLSQFLNNSKLSESAALAIRNMSDKSDAITDPEMVKNHLLSSLTLQVTIFLSIYLNNLTS